MEMNYHFALLNRLSPDEASQYNLSDCPVLLFFVDVCGELAYISVLSIARQFSHERNAINGDD